MCVLTLFDDGWPYPAIAVALGITEQEATDIATGDPVGDYVFRRSATLDHGEKVIVRDESGAVVNRVRQM